MQTFFPHPAFIASVTSLGARANNVSEHFRYCAA